MFVDMDLEKRLEVKMKNFETNPARRFVATTFMSIIDFIVMSYTVYSWTDMEH